MELPRPVFLIGFMASGKTTLGRALAAALPAISFVDLDEAVEEYAGCSVSQIFASRGEDGFRALESEMLRRKALPGVLIACGGGTPCRAENMDFMLSAGTVVRLDASVDTLVRRLLEADPDQRPLVKACIGSPGLLRQRVEQMISERMPHYSRAPFVFDADRLDDERQVAEAVERFASQFLASPSNKM